jgi:hypothetical protein
MSAALDVRDDEAQRLDAPVLRRRAVAERTATFPEEFLRRPAVEGLVRAVGVVPLDVGVDLHLDLAKGERDEDAPESLVLEGPDEALDDRDAALLADGAEAGTDAALFAPGAVIALKLRAPVRHDVLGVLSCGGDGALEDLEHLAGGRLLLEDAAGENGAGE